MESLFIIRWIEIGPPAASFTQIESGREYQAHVVANAVTAACTNCAAAADSWQRRSRALGLTDSGADRRG